MTNCPMQQVIAQISKSIVSRIVFWIILVIAVIGALNVLEFEQY